MYTNKNKSYKVAIHNLGCKVNAYEAEQMKNRLCAAGFEIVPFDAGADVYIINTCTVTNIADRKSRQMLRRAKKFNPEALVIACGCYVDAKDKNPEVHKEDENIIDAFVRNDNKEEIVELISGLLISKSGVKKMPLIDNSNKNSEKSDVLKRKEPMVNIGGHTRGFLKVEDGCDRYCAYCIIPYVRGAVKSRPISEVIAEANNLVAVGYKEIVLTGIHLSSYGKDIGSSLIELLEELNCIEGIKRLRLGSLEPKLISDEFVYRLSGLSKICPHFHLSLQSGCDETLKRMKRRYTKAEYENSCMLLRSAYVNPALTTDVIVGFPQESDAEFKESYDFINKIGFYETHIFQYSIREGTLAAKMDGQIEAAIKKERSERLAILNKEKQLLYESTFLGKQVCVLIEEIIKENDEVFAIGHTDEYLKIKMPIEESLDAGSLINMLKKWELTNISQITH
ncbi:MAG: tRNA (N(6)-L-threonylcarbamoyladenosine(37)-C(2))-methylthiotransferase MtaB [Lachnospiraceae bacterium]|jgi:threonylcarbamoyladenosine tRNA methylthiotransferase MtaB|nr:tRNA (N(6)-L-threonylcarbamoyladenosine(37)-C(2))-methylthiotransferase MtaB [Lachnospiraceae bacterium]